MDRHSRELTESAAGGQVRCRERRDFAGHSEVAMSTSRNSTPLYEAIRSLVLSARQSAARGVNLLAGLHELRDWPPNLRAGTAGRRSRAIWQRDRPNELAARLTGEFGSGFSIRPILSICGSSILPIRSELHKLPRRRLGNSRPSQLPRHCLGNCRTASDQSQPAVFPELVALCIPDRSQRGGAQLLRD